MVRPSPRIQVRLGRVLRRYEGESRRELKGLGENRCACEQRCDGHSRNIRGGRVYLVLLSIITRMLGMIQQTHRCEAMRQHFNIHFFGVINLTNAVLPYMRARRAGTVIMVGSRTAFPDEFYVSLVTLHEVTHTDIEVTFVPRASASTQPVNLPLIVRPQSNGCLAVLDLDLK